MRGAERGNRRGTRQAKRDAGVHTLHSPTKINNPQILRIIPPMKHIKYTKYQLRHLARDMRNNPTNAERVLWYHLRMNRLDGYRFLRQKVVGNAIVDFVCPKANLVIELDGGQHNEHSYADDARTRRLNRSGYRVIRFWNHEVTNNIEGVIHTIRQALRD